MLLTTPSVLGRGAGALAVLGLLISGCSGGDDDSAGGSSNVSVSADAAEACADIISLIGYAEQALLPPGQEDEQSFDLNVRGRIAESVGTAEREADTLPADLRREALALAAAGKGLTNAQTPHEDQVAALLEWRRIAEDITRDCAEADADSG